MTTTPDFVEGSHIWIHRLEAFGFDDVVEMLLEHCDTPEHQGKVVVLGAYIHHPVSYFRQLYPGRKIVIYQLEQMVGSETWHPVSRIVEHLRGADEIWDLDPLNAKFLSWREVHVDRILPMRYTRALERITLNQDPSIDVLFYGYLNERRFRVVRQLEQQLYKRIKLVWLYGVTGNELDRYIADAKIILNLHAFEPWNRQEQVRIFYPLINGRLVVSEVSEYNAFGDAIVEVEPERLGDTLLHWLADDRWQRGGLAGRDAFRHLAETTPF